MNHYSLYNIRRFKKIRDRKIQIHSQKIRQGYLFVFSCVVVLLFALPYAELINSPDGYFETILLECLIFNVATFVVLILYYFVASKFLPRYHVEDDEKRLRFFSDNQVRLMIIIVLLIGLMILLYASLHNFLKISKNPTKTDHFIIEMKKETNNEIYFKDTVSIPKFEVENYSEVKSGYYTTYFVNQFILCLFLFCSIGTFTLIFHSLKSRLEKKTGKKFKNEEIYIYWYNFLKSLILENPLILLSAVLFASLSISSFILRGKGDISDRHFIYSVAFYSFWFASLTAIVSPFFTRIRILNTTFANFTSHRLGNAILSNINDHIVVIGIGTLGSQLIENCFYDIHPEGYNADSICPNSDKHICLERKDISDYDLIINNELELQLISRRIVIIEKNDLRFSNLYKIGENKTVGLYNIADSHKLNISLMCVYGNANKNTILSLARCENSQVIVNTAPDSKLSLYLSISFPAQKLILSVNSATAFEFLTSTTYDRAIYTIDIQQVEGIAVSQMIFCWAYTNISNNLSAIAKTSKTDKDFKKKLSESLRWNMKDESVSKLKKKIVLGGKDKILIAGNGSYIYYIIQSLWMTLKFTVGLNDKEINELLEKKLIVLTSDEKIKKEIKKEIREEIKVKKGEKNVFKSQEKINKTTKINTWSFYPIRDRNTQVVVSYLETKDRKDRDSQIRIPIYFKDILNFDSYLDIFKENKLGLIVLMNDNSLDAVKMFTEVANASEILTNSSTRVLRPPHIMVYSLATDEIFLEAVFKKYFAFNIKRIEKVGFPSQLMKESRISKDYISSNQVASMLRSLYINKHLENSFDSPIGEIIFSAIQKPGALAYLVSKLCGLQFKSNRRTVKIPNFIYYFSTEMNIYRDTFIFKGTAKLEDLNSNDTFEDSIRYCFLNCDEKYRNSMEEVIFRNLNLSSRKDKINLNQRKYDSGMFTHYPISSILKHPAIHNDILNLRRRLHVSTTQPLPCINKDRRIKDLEVTDFLMIFNIAKFCVWAEGEETPGSYASILANLALGSIAPLSYLNNAQSYVPEILFSNNRPSFDIKGNSESGRTIAQDSFYIKLVKKEVDYSKAFKNIRAVKLNLASQLIRENLEWSNYLFELKNHLLFSGGDYSFYIIEKIFLEGTDLEGRQGFSEISLYKKVNCNIEMKKPVSDFLVFLRKDYYSSNNPQKNIVEFSLDLEFFGIQNTQVASQEYEMILIRNDIVAGAKHEFLKQILNGKFQNMIFAINDL